MPNYTLFQLFLLMQAARLTKSQRHFSAIWLAKDPSYLNDFTAKFRFRADIPARTTDILRARLLEVAGLLGDELQAELHELVEQIDDATEASARWKR